MAPTGSSWKKREGVHSVMRNVVKEVHVWPTKPGTQKPHHVHICTVDHLLSCDAVCVSMTKVSVLGVGVCLQETLADTLVI